MKSKIHAKIMPLDAATTQNINHFDKPTFEKYSLLQDNPTQDKMKLPLKLDEDHPMLAAARFLFPLFALGMAILNIMGKPPQFVHDHWDKDGFGNGFFPWFEADPDDKRFIAGITELSGVLMVIGTHRYRPLGYATIALMYGRGAMVCRSLGLGVAKYGSVGVASGIAFWLLLQEEVDMLHDLLGLSYRTNDPPFESKQRSGGVKKVKSW